MSIFKEASDIARANIYDLLEKAKDPRKQARLMVIDMEKELQKSTQALGEVKGQIAAKEAAIARNLLDIADADSKAKAFLQAGQEEAAKQQLVRKQTELKENATFQSLVDGMRPQCSQLEMMVTDIRSKLGEVRTMQAQIEATGTVAKAMKTASKVFDTDRSDSIYGQMNKMQEKVDAQMGAAMGSMGTYSPSANAMLANSEADAELAQMKADLGL
jgi:phage shock protein A